MAWTLLSCALPVRPLLLSIDSPEALEAVQERLRELGYQREEPPPVLIRLEAGGVPGDLGSLLWPHSLEITLEGEGAALPRDSQLLLAGARVAVRALRHPGGSTPQALLRIEATERVYLEDLHIADAPASDGPARGAYGLGTAIQIDAHGPGVDVDALRVTICGAKGSPSVALLAPEGDYGRVTWRSGRFYGGSAPAIAVERARSFSTPGTLYAD